MIEAIQKAVSIERLDSIDQSRLKGLSSKKLVEDQSKRIAASIESKRRELQSGSQSKAA